MQWLLFKSRWVKFHHISLKNSLPRFCNRLSKCTVRKFFNKRLSWFELPPSSSSVLPLYMWCTKQIQKVFNKQTMFQFVARLVHESVRVADPVTNKKILMKERREVYHPRHTTILVLCIEEGTPILARGINVLIWGIPRNQDLTRDQRLGSSTRRRPRKGQEPKTGVPLRKDLWPETACPKKGPRPETRVPFPLLTDKHLWKHYLPA